MYFENRELKNTSCLLYVPFFPPQSCESKFDGSSALHNAVQLLSSNNKAQSHVTLHPLFGDHKGKFFWFMVSVNVCSTYFYRVTIITSIRHIHVADTIV